MPLTNYLDPSQRAKVINMIVVHNLDVAARNPDVYGAASNALNQSQPVANGPAPLIDRPLSIDDIKNGLESATKAKIDKSGLFARFYSAIKSASHTDALEVIGFWAGTGDYTEAEITALTTLCSAKMPDPNWPATIEGPSWWQSEFMAQFPTFSAVVEGVPITNQCHPAFIKESLGDPS